MSSYDRIGRTYASTRRADARIAAAIQGPLAGMSSVINMGAGAGSYEPTQTILAVEPSTVMIAQRPSGSAPALRGVAEAIPLVDDAADAVLAVLTVHHWSDLEAGVAQMRRVARSRIVICTFDPAITSQYWLLHEYLPALARAGTETAAPLDRLLDALGGGQVTAVPIPHDCTDGFTAAYWRRPAAYLDPRVRAGMSVFATAEPEVVTTGLDHLAHDLDSGGWARRHADLLGLDELDAGYRLITSDLTTS